MNQSRASPITSGACSGSASCGRRYGFGYTPAVATTRPPLQGRAALPESGIRRVSRRPVGEDVIRDISILQRTINGLRGADLVPRGVYRFPSHEEADAWMMRLMASTHARRSSKTS
jgi:hypothetical protein